ncbi:adenylate kinase [Oscillatoriales cyanobacterium LEGE 11467]|uniref:Adenylate kinase n=1 Tax=Zarconia navalis LEGE 11467 TaxID=1828826 RepID=A0A928VU04_9CYAN|nr:adenylate kinase [Zarconia navalis]MBE9039389.1 adenylate kinase [Zarconia navalis LEGE 11467]
MMRLIFLGAPGAGKGTQAVNLAQTWQIPHISTGDILRQAVADKSPLGIKAKSYMDGGELVPDSLVIALIEERLSQPDTRMGWILDGFPRNLTQANSLGTLLQRMVQPCDRAVYFTVETEALVERMLARGRKDDNGETIRRRLEVYQEQTTPLVDFYRQQGCLTQIDGNRSVEEVTQALYEALKPTVGV